VNADGPESREDLLASLLAAGDEALAGGQPADALCPPGTPEELRPELERDLAYVRAVRRLLRPPEVAAAEAAGPLPWTALGRFELGPELGRGGCGLVFLAHDPLLGREVAVKVPRAEILATPGWRDRFLREARAAAGLDHPNVVPVYEAGEVGPVCFLVSAYCPGPTLAAWVEQQRGPVPVRTAAGLVAALADGVQHAHGRGVLHRDLKPSNVLLEPLPPGTAPPPDGLAFTPRLTDFGLAKLLQEGATTDQTRTGAVLGTVNYMAPEQAAGRSRQVGPTADVYALGAILYELLTGRPPFQGETELDTLRQVRDEESVPIRRLRSAVPRDLETVCLKCLEKEPARRYATVGALADDLRRFLAGEPIRARPPGPAGRVGRWARRNPALAAASGLAAASLAAVVALAIGFAASQADAVARIQHEQQQTKAALALAERRSALLAYDRGLSLCEQGQVGPGMLWLARSLESVGKLPPADAADLEGPARANLAAWRRELMPRRGIFAHDEKGVRAVAYCADGRIIATAGWRGTARFWDAATGGPRGGSLGDPWAGEDVSTGYPVYAAAFSPDGKTILTTSLDRTCHLRDAATGRPTCQPFTTPSAVSSAAFSPDGRALLTGLEDGTALWWDAATARPRDVPPLRHQKSIKAVAFSPDGRTVLTGSADRTACFWETATGKRLGDPLRHGGWVQAVAFRPDGRTAVTGCNDGAVRFWEVATGKPLGSPLPHEDVVGAVAFSPDGGTVLTGCNDRAARLWSVATRQQLRPPLRHENGVGAVAYGPDGRTVLTAGWNEPARLWDAAPPDPPVRTLLHPDQVRAVAFSSDGQTVLTGGKDCTARFWDVATGRTVGPTLAHGERVLAVAYSPDGRTVLTGSADSKARLWDAATGALIGQPLLHKAQVNAVAFSPDGHTALTGSDDGTCRFWDARAGKPLAVPPLMYEFQHVQEVAYSPDGGTVSTSDDYSCVCFWTAATGKRLGEPIQHPGKVMGLAFRPDGRAVLTGSNLTAQQWDVATRRALGPPLRHRLPVRAVAYSPDGRTIATAGDDRTARLWDAATGKPVGLPLLHEGEVTALAFSPDGRLLLTGSWDRTARLWPVPDPPTGEPERIRLWVQVLTGMELDEGGTVHVLDAPTWQERRRRLDELGGPQ
jgi:WD40 repeat protein